VIVTVRGLDDRIELMAERTHQALLIGFREVDMLRIVSALSSVDVEFHRAPWMDGLGTFLAQNRFDAILFAYPTETQIENFLEALRAQRAVSRRAGVVALADSGHLEAVRRHLGSGVNRVVHLNDQGDAIRDSVVSLLSVAPRFPVRAPIQLSAAASDDTAAVHCVTENLSTTGMLVSCAQKFPVGLPLDFAMSLPSDTNPIRGAARVARLTDPRRERVIGIGASFLSFPGDDQARLHAILARCDD
jgi:hypothetical protein